jgi:hypothetical protein
VRSTPKGWEAVVAELAERRADVLEVRVAELRVLARNLCAPNGEPCDEISGCRQSRCGPGAAHTLPYAAGVTQARADLRP